MKKAIKYTLSLGAIGLAGVGSVELYKSNKENENLVKKLDNADKELKKAKSTENTIREEIKKLDYITKEMTQKLQEYEKQIEENTCIGKEIYTRDVMERNGELGEQVANLRNNTNILSKEGREGWEKIDEFNECIDESNRLIEEFQYRIKHKVHEHNTGNTNNAEEM